MKNISLHIPFNYERNIQKLIRLGIVSSRSEAIRIALKEFLDKYYDKNLKLFPLLSNYPGPFMPDLWIELLSEKLKYDLIIVTAFPYDHVIPAFIAAKK